MFNKIKTIIFNLLFLLSILFVTNIFIACNHSDKNTIKHKNKIQKQIILYENTKTFYLKSFLTQKNLPKGTVIIQNLPLQGVPLKDKLFKKYAGLYAGLKVWGQSKKDLLWRIVDVRWMFKSPQEAEKYYKATLKINSENLPEVKNYSKIGKNCKFFGGVIGLNGINLLSYFYLFRVKNIIVKIYVAKGPFYNLTNTGILQNKIYELAKIIYNMILKELN